MILRRLTTALRSDPDILKALKLRNAQVDGRVTDLVTTVEILGMNEMFARDIAPGPAPRVLEGSPTTLLKLHSSRRREPL